ncbi:MAG: hypothetical protein LLG13_18760 [Bacteroidales bacterium]|nr:hypothetical protein [Bacteroidales bacterium]
MKKILILIILVSLPALLQAALSGNGTYASPWSGTLEGNTTWSGTVYINGDITVDNEKLTIDAGTIIIFLSETADLIITGTGQLEANGTSGSRIRFTSDDDNDGSYGETGERWGHISFQSMGSAGASLIDYCIIEFGDVSSTSLLPVNPCQYGGAIHAAFSNLSISFCEIRSCKAGWGGGIFVGDGQNPTLSNCYIHNNISTNSGGGVYFWKNSYSSFSNSIVTFNSSTGAGGAGGIFLGGLAKNVYIINCVISNNSASQQSYGHNIRFFNNTNTPKPKIINSIIWYPANSIIYNGGTASASDFVNCAIQNPVSGSFTNCITLNASNTDASGPNFTATDGSDWSINFISPCRDAGVDTYTGVTIPTTDYAGNSRVNTTDIGAYEVQYSGWNKNAGSTDWNTDANWAGGVPTGSRDVLIPAGATNYPTGSTSQDFTLGSGKYMIIEAGASLTLNNLTNNGTLRLNSSSSGFASLILNGYSRGTGGTEEIKLFLTGGGDASTYKWHYISSPVSSLSTDVFTVETLNLAQFIESRPTTSLMQGWVAYDGYEYSGGSMTGITFDVLFPGQGYNYYDNIDHTFSFGGSFNTSNITMSLGYSGIPAFSGFNLLGNPFTSGLNWDDIVKGTYFTYPSNTSKGLYFTRNNTQCSYIGGVGTPGDVTGIIPPMQGFFVKTNSTGNSLTLPAAARTHTSIHSTYKGSKDVIPLVRLALSESTSSDDETVVRFDAQAKSDLDYDFDAVKMFLSSAKTSIYTSMGGVDYAINGQPFPETITEIPVTVNMTSSGNHKISATQLQGLDDYYLTLTDNTTGFIANLKTTPDLTFTSAAGTITGRFVLKAGLLSTGMENPEVTDKLFIIYQANNMLNIQTLSDNWDGKSGSVRVMDLTGRTINSLANAEFRKSSLNMIQAPVTRGLYLVEIRAGINRYIEKVIVR